MFVKSLFAMSVGCLALTLLQVAVVIFFVPYCTLEIPSNILLKKFKPHVW